MRVEIQVKVSADQKIEDIHFLGKGCAISQASASMLTELAKGRPLEWVKELSKNDILKMLGTSDLGPARIKCALLSMKVLKTGVYGYLGAALDEPSDHFGIRPPCRADHLHARANSSQTRNLCSRSPRQKGTLVRSSGRFIP